MRVHLIGSVQRAAVGDDIQKKLSKSSREKYGIFNPIWHIYLVWRRPFFDSSRSTRPWINVYRGPGAQINSIYLKSALDSFGRYLRGSLENNFDIHVVDSNLKF